MHADGRAPRFVVRALAVGFAVATRPSLRKLRFLRRIYRANGSTFSFIYRANDARDKCEALAVRDNRLLRLELSLLFVSSFQDDTLDASFRKVVVPEVDIEAIALLRVPKAPAGQESFTFTRHPSKKFSNRSICNFCRKMR